MTRPVLRLLLAVATAFTITNTTASSLGPISEETPPAVCDPGSFVTEVTCTGAYCDNMRIGCSPVIGVTPGRAEWTPFFSEEGTGGAACPDRHYVAGISCNGDYCDNVSLYCVEASNLHTLGCSDSGFVSEEQGKLHLGWQIVDKAGIQIAAKGARCDHDYCDNIAFDVCEVASQ